MGFEYDKLKESFTQLLNENWTRFVQIRQYLHSIPELSRREIKTSEFIRNTLESAGISYKAGVGEKTGIEAIIYGERNDCTIALRADMDGLPITEETGLPYASMHPNCMHACGHDFHMASVLSIGLILNEVKSLLPCNIKLIFQPAEEDGPVGGAKPMISDGVLESPTVDAIFAVHVAPWIPLNHIAVPKGPVMASADNFKMKIIGSGGHAALPHKTIDPITTTGHIIVSLNSIVSRNISPTDSGVITIGRIEGGNRRNVIPDTVLMEGTVRALQQHTREILRSRMQETCTKVSESFNARCEIEWFPSFDVTINDNEMALLTRNAISKSLGKDILIQNVMPNMTSEDFGYYLKEVPGAMFLVGTDEGIQKSLHNSTLTINDEVLRTIIEAFFAVTAEYFAVYYTK